MSTEDTDLVHIARQLSLIWHNFMRLGMIHLIPAERLHKRYLLRLRQDMLTSEAIFASRRSQPVPEATGGMRLWLRYLYNYTRRGRHEASFYLAAQRGTKAAHVILNGVN